MLVSKAIARRLRRTTGILDPLKVERLKGCIALHE